MKKGGPERAALLCLGEGGGGEGLTRGEGIGPC